MYSEVSTLWTPTIMKPDLGSRVQVSGLGVGKGIWGFEVWRVWGRFMGFLAFSIAQGKVSALLQHAYPWS